MSKLSNQTSSATAKASPNIALIKYWGNRDHALRIPANGSISITLRSLHTTTRVTLDPTLERDQLEIKDAATSDSARDRASQLLDEIRILSPIKTFAHVESENNFPMGAGIASSASAFAALTVAACEAYGIQRDTTSLSRLARLASGSAARSLCSGFVELHSADQDEGAFAESLYAPEHWDLIDIIAVVDIDHKAVSSSDGHVLADTSPLQATRVSDTPRRLDLCRQALATRDFALLARTTELDSNMMHAVMMTSSPPLHYWQPESVMIMKAVERWREEGLEVCYTIDAGPNVHCICTESSSDEVKHRLYLLGILLQTYVSTVGPGAMLVSS